MRCISLAAYLSLINVLHYAAKGVGVLSGNALPATNPSGFVSEIHQPVLHECLERLDPITVAYYVLLAVGLRCSLRLPRKKAIGVSVVAYLAVSLCWIGLAGVGAAAGAMFGGAG
jgi:hypothetical protein